MSSPDRGFLSGSLLNQGRWHLKVKFMNQSSEYKMLSHRIKSLVRKCVSECHFEHGRCNSCGCFYSDDTWWENADQHTRKLANQWIDNRLREKLINAKARIALRKLAEVS